MRVFLWRAFFSFLLSGGWGCGHETSQSQKTSHTSMDVNVPKEGVVTPTQLRNVSLALSQFRHDGKYQVPTKELTDAMKLEGRMGEMMPRILASREPQASMECDDLRCRIVSRGQEFSFEADWINVPLFGKPTIYLEKMISLEFMISEDARITEICRLSGVRGKAGMMSATPDGARYELDGEAIKVFVMDTGSGGSYPIEQCNPNGLFR